MRTGRKFSPETLDLLTAGTMIPACIFVAWLLWWWMNSNRWLGPEWEIWFVLFGIGTGFYNFFRMISRYGKGKTGKPGDGQNH
jgi:drug/metabolite transporter (DMT)-like permease